MGFKQVEDVAQAKWFPVSCGTGPTANTVYMGAIVKMNVDGVLGITDPIAAPEVATYPFGIVAGFNVAPGLATYNSTYKCESASAVISQATMLAKAGNVAFTEGFTHKGELQTMAKVVMLHDSGTVIEGPIYNAALGTAPGVVTCSTADVNGLTGMVHSAADVATTANNNMYYCRTGKNAGLYRMSYAASATTPTFYSPWPFVWAVGDTFCVANIGIGRQKISFGPANTGLWVENSSALTNYWVVNVHSINLEVAGQETVQFSFAAYSHI